MTNTVKVDSQSQSARHKGGIMYVLTLLFACRVAGQAMQLWAPRSYLPAFDAFQGSTLPYWSLLSVQILIILVMAILSGRVLHNQLMRWPRVGKALLWIGGIYMTVMLARLAVGLVVPEAPHWFKVWIPSIFHLVLATFLLTLSSYQRHRQVSDVPGEKP